MKKLKKIAILVLAIIAALCFYACNECPHDWVVVEKTDATCVATGIASYRCPSCRATKEEILPVSPNAHDWEEIDREEPTCSERGWAYCKCGICETTKEDILPIDSDAHVFGTEWDSDYTHHWKLAICEHIGAISQKTEHTFENGECVDCGFEEIESIRAEWNILVEDYVEFIKTQIAFREGTNLKVNLTSDESNQLTIITERGCYYHIEDDEIIDEWVVKDGDKYFMYYFEDGIYDEHNSRELGEQDNPYKNEPLLYNEIGVILEQATVVNKESDGVYNLEGGDMQFVATFEDGKLVALTSGTVSITISYGDAVMPSNHFTEWNELFNEFVEFAKTQTVGGNETNFVLISQLDNNETMKYVAQGNGVYGCSSMTYEEDGENVSYAEEMWLYNLGENKYAEYAYHDGTYLYAIEELDPDDSDGSYSYVFTLYDLCVLNYGLEGATLVEKIDENKYLLTNEDESVESAIVTLENGKIIKIEIDYKYDRKDVVLTISYGNAQIPRHPDDGHSWTLSETVPPTCGEYGNKIYNCSSCEEIKMEMYGKPTGEHDEKEVYRQPSTCEERGWIEYGCARCSGYYKSERLPLDNDNHVYGEEWEYDERHHWKEVLCDHGEQVAQKVEHDFEDGYCLVCNAPEDEWKAVINGFKEFAQTQVAFTAGTNVYIQLGNYAVYMVTEDVVYIENQVYDEEKEMVLDQKTWFVMEGGQIVKYVYNPIDNSFGTAEITAEDTPFITQPVLYMVAEMMLSLVTVEIEKIGDGVFYVADRNPDNDYENDTMTFTFVDGKLVEMRQDYYGPTGDEWSSYEINSFIYDGFEVPSFEWYALVDEYIEFIETQPAYGEQTNYTLIDRQDGSSEYVLIACGNTHYSTNSDEDDSYENWIVKDGETYTGYRAVNGQFEYEYVMTKEEYSESYDAYLQNFAIIFTEYKFIEKVSENVYLCETAVFGEPTEIYITFEDGKITKAYAEGVMDCIISYGDAQIPEIPKSNMMEDVF